MSELQREERDFEIPFKLAIVTPSFNQGEYIEQAIDSVLSAKSRVPLTYAVVDGGSTDGTVEIIRRYEKHLAFWVSEPDGGQSNAINKGLQRLDGEYWGYLNSDDYYVEGALEEVAETFASSDALWVTGTGRYFEDEAKTVRDMVPTADWSIEEVLLGFAEKPIMVSSQVSNFMSRRILDRFGYFDESLHYVMDIDFALRVMLDGIRPKILPRVLGMARLHGDSKTVSQGKIAFSREFEKVLSNLDLSSRKELEAVRQNAVAKLAKRNALNEFFANRAGDPTGRSALISFLRRYPRAIMDREILGAIRRGITGRS